MIPLPEHKCGLYLEHNPHNDLVHQKHNQPDGDYSIATWLQFTDEIGCASTYDLSDDAKNEIVQKGEIWTIQWYPNTSIGFIASASFSLKELLAECGMDVKLSDPELIALFPDHLWLKIEHNVHRNVWESSTDWLDGRSQVWLCDADKRKAIDTDNIWAMEWRNSKRQYTLFASTLDVLLSGAFYTERKQP